MSIVWRLEFIENGEIFRRFDCSRCEGPKHFKVVINGEEVLDGYPVVFAIGNHIKIASPDVYEITIIDVRNGPVETLIEVFCAKVRTDVWGNTERDG